MQMVGRFAETEDPVLFARFGEFDKCEFIKLNAPEEAWASTDDGAGLLVKVDALREQAREALVSAVRFITPCTRSPHLIQLYLHIPVRAGSNHCRRYSPQPLLAPHRRPSNRAAKLEQV